MKRVLDTRTFVVLGEGMAAGVGHFSLSEDIQAYSYPALVAERLGLSFAQPLLQPPGVGDVGFRQQPAIVPDLLQTSVLCDFPRDAADLSNLSVPGLRLAEALGRRPSAPLVQSGDAKQTLLNLILGLPSLTRAGAKLPTQLEYARSRRPTLALVALGYQEVLEPLADGFLQDPKAADLAGFEDHYGRLLAALATKKRSLVVATIPDPLATAYFSDLESAAHIIRTEASFLRGRFALAEGDLINLPALIELGYQFTARQLGEQLNSGSVLSAADAERVRRGVAKLNQAIRRQAQAHGAVVWDLGGFLADLAESGVEVGGRQLSTSYLGGLYLLNGVYPGRTGHALIANDLLRFLNQTYDQSFAEVDVEAIAAADANTLSKVADGPTFTDEYLQPRTAAELPPLPPPDPSLINLYPPFEPDKLNIFPIQTTYLDPPFDIGGVKQANCCEPAVGIPAGGLSDPHLEVSLVLPEGLEQTLSLNKVGSYFGDALRAVDFPEEKPFLEGLPTFGASGNTFFGGLAMTDSHLQGEVRIRFAEPDSSHISRFEITLPGGLAGDDGTLAAPKMFKLPSQLNFVQDVPGLVSSGELNLDTGVVTNLRFATLFLNTPTLTLFGVNPNLPAAPLIFPGPPNAGSTWARFEQRSDGRLDFSFAGHLFLPLGKEFGGDPIRFPLPFGNPRLQCASIVARGTTLHPHLVLTTKEDLGPQLPAAELPEIPVNTVMELSPGVHNTSFGDVFGLNIDELGGEGTGRSHLMGRLRMQFGPRSGDTVPLALSFLPPGGLLSPDPEPLPYLPPGTARGMVGFNEQLVFPSGVTYNQTKLSSSLDPNNLAIGAIDLRSGRILGELLCRSFVVQQLFVNLGKVEPCTPADSFLYQGPARFARGPGGETVFGFAGEVFIPYPQGFRFPSPSADGTPPFVVVEESRLDPFLRLEAMVGGTARNVLCSPTGKKGGGERAWIQKTSSIGEKFSYRFSIPCDPATAERAFFEYVNHSAGGEFKLSRLSWLRATNSRTSTAASGEADTVTFGGFGKWSEDAELHQVSVQISTSAEAPFIGIQVDGGTTSNVNTKPVDIDTTLPFGGES